LYNDLRIDKVRTRYKAQPQQTYFLKGITMKYLLLCQMQPAAFVDVPQTAIDEIMQSMMAYNNQLIQAGVLVAAGQLAPPESAQRVYAEKGRIKTKEGYALKGDTQIGGYYLIDVPGEPEATGWAAKCPAAQFGSLEVRQVAYSPM
jgi:hypothetical protein